MSTPPTFDLGRLREIGWSQWDPISLSQMGDDLWEGDGPVADEYDLYLLDAAEQTWNGASPDQIADYLLTIETDWMGLSPMPDARPRAIRVARALNDYVVSLRT